MRGFPEQSRAFLPLPCGDYRARSGVSGDLLQHLRGIAASPMLLPWEPWTRAVDPLLTMCSAEDGSEVRWQPGVVGERGNNGNVRRSFAFAQAFAPWGIPLNHAF